MTRSRAIDLLLLVPTGGAVLAGFAGARWSLLAVNLFFGLIVVAVLILNLSELRDGFRGWRTAPRPIHYTRLAMAVALPLLIIAAGVVYGVVSRGLTLTVFLLWNLLVLMAAALAVRWVMR